MSEGPSIDATPTPHPYIRLVYSRPADLPPLPPRRPVNLAIAIERHLQGSYGYSDDQFAVVFARPADAADAGGRAPSTL